MQKNTFKNDYTETINPMRVFFFVKFVFMSCWETATVQLVSSVAPSAG